MAKPVVCSASASAGSAVGQRRGLHRAVAELGGSGGWTRQPGSAAAARRLHQRHRGELADARHRLLAAAYHLPHAPEEVLEHDVTGAVEDAVERRVLHHLLEGELGQERTRAQHRAPLGDGALGEIAGNQLADRRVVGGSRSERVGRGRRLERDAGARQVERRHPHQVIGDRVEPRDRLAERGALARVGEGDPRRAARRAAGERGDPAARDRERRLHDPEAVSLRADQGVGRNPRAAEANAADVRRRHRHGLDARQELDVITALDQEQAQPGGGAERTGAGRRRARQGHPQIRAAHEVDELLVAGEAIAVTVALRHRRGAGEVGSGRPLAEQHGGARAGSHARGDARQLLVGRGEVCWQERESGDAEAHRQAAAGLRRQRIE